MDIPERLESIWQRKVSRSEFIKGSVASGLSVTAAGWFFDIFLSGKAFASAQETRGLREALFYERLGELAQCQLCINRCSLSPGQRGFCRVRENVGGKLHTLVYELICAAHIDPVEKKPLFHVLPGSKTFSIATAGCNSRCKFCQNWTISQRPPEETVNRVLRVDDLVSGTLSSGCSSISYTYTEPIVFYEYSMAAAEKARGAGLRNIWVTGGKINPEPLTEACRLIDAANVDLKAFNDGFLRDVCAQTLENITQTLKIMKREGVWIEITNLIVPTLNDNMEDIKKMSAWISENLGEEVPLHFSRFWPQYQLKSLYPTPLETMEKARDIALSEGLRYVYIGNIPSQSAKDTLCPGCGKTLIKRMGYMVGENNVSSEGKCSFCGRNIPGIWK